MAHPDDLPVEAGYTLWAPLYDDDGNPLTAIEGPAIARWFGEIRDRPALDLGCGTGRHSEALAERGARVVAADLTTAMLMEARGRLGTRQVDWLRLSLPGPLPFRDETFALVVMGLVAEHLTDLVGTLREVARVLIPGGRCLLSTLHPDRTATGQSARFIDPETGLRRSIATVHRVVADYLRDAATAGLELVEETTLIVPPGLAESLPRAVPYVGKPLGWAACWSRRAITS